MPLHLPGGDLQSRQLLHSYLARFGLCCKGKTRSAHSVRSLWSIFELWANFQCLIHILEVVSHLLHSWDSCLKLRCKLGLLLCNIFGKFSLKCSLGLLFDTSSCAFDLSLMLHLLCFCDSAYYGLDRFFLSLDGCIGLPGKCTLLNMKRNNNF